MNDIRIASLRDADRDFGLRALFSLDEADDGAAVIVCVGDTRLENLPLDFSALDAWTGVPKAGPGAFLGVAVYGDLAVSDGIINAGRDSGPFLWVRGDVRAKNLAVAGGEVRIEGGLEAAQTIAGVRGLGRTVVRGDARAEAVLARGHLMEFHAGLTAELVVADDLLRVGDPGRVEVAGWSGRAHDLRGGLLPGLGSASTRALRLLAPGLRDLDGGLEDALAAIEQGCSLLDAPASTLSAAFGRTPAA